MGESEMHNPSNVTSIFDESFQCILQKDFWNFVRFNGNCKLPVHRWFYFKEGFSADLLPLVLKYIRVEKKKNIDILDPFLGSGTTLLSAQVYDEVKISGTGVEVNPFLHFVARTKLMWNSISLKKLSRNLARLKRNLRSAELSGLNASLDEIPDLSTFHNEKYFLKENLTKLVHIKNEIDKIPYSKEKDILRLALASIIEDASFLKKDGRALRYLPEKVPKNPIQNFFEKTNMIKQDIAELGRKMKQVNEISTHNTRAETYLENTGRKFDLAFFSPPYPNKLDYVEVYKLETWFLDFITNHRDFRELSRDTFVSHDSHNLSLNYPSARLPDFVQSYLFEIFPEAKSRERNMTLKYLENFHNFLEGLFSHIKINGYCTIIVGNPLFKIGDKSLVVIPIDFMLIFFSQEIGFELVSRIFDYKRPRGVKMNDNERKMYKESIIILKKNHA